MAARNANFSAQYQAFLTEVYTKERDMRLMWHRKQKAQNQDRNRPNQLDVLRRKIEEDSKPSDAFLRRVPDKAYEPRYLRGAKVAEDASGEKPRVQPLIQDMRPITPEVRKELFEGIAKEGKGRYQYLHRRNEKNPEDKFNFPLLSSWEYGWRLGDVMPKEAIEKPKHGRTRIVAATFYFRNGIGVPPVVC